jgi:hypothetical protein
MHCIILFLTHSCSCTLDHVEPELEVQVEQDQAKDLTNLALGSRQAPLHLNTILEFYFNFILIMILECVLGYRS